MPRIDQSLFTPIYVKQDQDMPWPGDPVFYLLTADNLYLCRNHRDYRSCVPAPQWPTELAGHAVSLVPNYPRIPRASIEQIRGFFGHMSAQQAAEAIVLLAWDDHEQVVRTIVPDQVAAVSQGRWGPAFPIGVKYQFPHDLPKHWRIFCDIHSHCEMAAYASQTDVDDEHNFNALHIVVGRLHLEPPEFHAEAVVDGKRFAIRSAEVIEGYQQRSPFPRQWLDRTTVTDYATFRDFDFQADQQARVGDTRPAIPTADSCDREEPHDINDEHWPWGHEHPQQERPDN